MPLPISITSDTRCTFLTAAKQCFASFMDITFRNANHVLSENGKAPETKAPRRCLERTRCLTLAERVCYGRVGRRDSGMPPPGPRRRASSDRSGTYVRWPSSTGRWTLQPGPLRHETPALSRHLMSEDALPLAHRLSRMAVQRRRLGHQQGRTAVGVGHHRSRRQDRSRPTPGPLPTQRSGQQNPPSVGGPYYRSASSSVCATRCGTPTNPPPPAGTGRSGRIEVPAAEHANARRDRVRRRGWWEDGALLGTMAQHPR